MLFFIRKIELGTGSTVSATWSYDLFTTSWYFHPGISKYLLSQKRLKNMLEFQKQDA